MRHLEGLGQGETCPDRLDQTEKCQVWRKDYEWADGRQRSGQDVIIGLLVDDQDRLPRLERQGIDRREIRERNILIAISRTKTPG